MCKPILTIVLLLRLIPQAALAQNMLPPPGVLQRAVEREAKRASLWPQSQTAPKKGVMARHPILFGALIGFGAGFLVGYAAGDDGVLDDFVASFNGLFLGGIGAGVGAGVGAIVEATNK